jgi:hypothetical protein
MKYTNNERPIVADKTAQVRRLRETGVVLLVMSSILRRFGVPRHNAQVGFTLSQVPAAIILLVAGLLSCFLGYRLFRGLLALYGFAGGAYLVSLFVDGLETWVGVTAIIGGGVAGALLLLTVYLAGLALLGASLGAMAISLFWMPASGDAEVWVVVGACLVGAVSAVVLQRYVIIVGTSFGGAWTAVVGTLALSGDAEAVAVAGGDLSQIYPVAPASGQVSFAVGWFGLALVSALVQLRATSASRKRPSTDD